MLLGELVVQHGFRTWFDRRSHVRVSLQFTFVLDMNSNFIMRKCALWTSSITII